METCNALAISSPFHARGYWVISEVGKAVGQTIYCNRQEYHNKHIAVAINYAFHAWGYAICDGANHVKSNLQDTSLLKLFTLVKY